MSFLIYINGYDKKIFEIFDEALFYKYEDQKNISDFNRLRKYILKYFHDKIPSERILISLYIIDDIILKIYNDDTNDIIEDINKLRDNVLYMLSFQKTIKDEQEIN